MSSILLLLQLQKQFPNEFYSSITETIETVFSNEFYSVILSFYQCKILAIVAIVSIIPLSHCKSNSVLSSSIRITPSCFRTGTKTYSVITRSYPDRKIYLQRWISSGSDPDKWQCESKQEVIRIRMSRGVSRE